MYKGGNALVTRHSVYVWPCLVETLIVVVDQLAFLLSVCQLVTLYKLQRPQRMSPSP